jgi:hypothetical protein
LKYFFLDYSLQTLGLLWYKFIMHYAESSCKCMMKVIVSFSLEKKERKERTAVVIQLHEQS